MLAFKNSLMLKKIIRSFLVIVIAIELIIITLALWNYFYELVWQGISTTSYKTEKNTFVRILNFFEIGIGAVIREHIIILCVPMVTYMLLRDRDRELLYSEEQMTEVTEAVKEGIIEGVEEVSHHDNQDDLIKSKKFNSKKDKKKEESKTDQNQDNSKVEKQDEDKQDLDTDKQDSNSTKEDINSNEKEEKDTSTDDFFATFGS